MDNLTHTMTGALIGQTGLKKKTGLGMATLMIAANLPDIDGVAMLTERGSLALRRGWTHGPLAMVVLPLILVALMYAFDRWQAWRGTRPADRAPVHLGWMLGLAYIGILSHPLLDFLNTYGIRCLMPFSERWFYGDAVFIIDLWMWLTLGIGLAISLRRDRKALPSPARPAFAALLLTGFYAGAMGVSSYVAERIFAEEVETRGMGVPEYVIASPGPFNPFRREIVYSLGHAYGFGEFWWTPGPRLTIDPTLVPTNMNDPAVIEAANRSQRIADFLYWSRLPFAEIIRSDRGTLVIVGDARYNTRPGVGRFIVQTTLPPGPGF